MFVLFHPISHLYMVMFCLSRSDCESGTTILHCDWISQLCYCVCHVDWSNWEGCTSYHDDHTGNSTRHVPSWSTSHSLTWWLTVCTLPLPSVYLVSPTASNDYTAVTAQLVFQSTVTLQCRSIPITDDTILENDEVFSVQLSTLDQDVILTFSTATVTIEDNDGEYKCSNRY